MNVVRHLFKDPLTHFVLIGALLFLSAGLMGDISGGQKSVVSISRTDIDEMITAFRKAHNRTPDSSERSELINQRIREEIFMREAINMGLISKDPVIRSHLADKVTFLADGLVDTRLISDDELRDYMLAHKDEYLSPASLSFEQIYFDPANRGANTEKDLLATLEAIRQGSVKAAKVSGDPSDIAARKSYATAPSIARVYGMAFVQILMNLELNEWTGPVESALGLHIVKVSQRKEAGMPLLDSVRDHLKQLVAVERYYKSVREQYEIVLPPSVHTENRK